MIDQRAGGLLLLVAAVAASVYVFFQRAPEASLYVCLVCVNVCMCAYVYCTSCNHKSEPSAMQTRIKLERVRAPLLLCTCTPRLLCLKIF